MGRNADNEGARQSYVRQLSLSMYAFEDHLGLVPRDFESDSDRIHSIIARPWRFIELEMEPQVFG